MRQIATIIKLYMLDIFRNKFLIMASIIIPFIFYPLMYFGGTQYFTYKKGFMENREISVTLDSDPKFSDLADILSSIKNLTLDENQPFKIFVTQKDGLPFYRIQLDSTNGDNLFFKKKIEKKLFDYYYTHVEDKTGIKDPKNYTTFNIEVENILDKYEDIRRLFSLLLPFFIVVFMASSTAAVSTEITAGERENNCAETIFTTHTNRRTILYGKIFASTIFGIFTGLVNMSILISLGYLGVKTFFNSVGTVSAFSISEILSPAMILVSVFSIFILAFVSSVIFIAVSSFAKTRKEANVMMTPTILFMIYGNIIVMIPALEPNLAIALIPIVNIALMLKLLISQSGDLYYVYISGIAAIIEFYFIIKFTLPIVESEEVIFGDSKTTFFKKIGNKLSWKREK
ncbi:MAG: hypothetical protein CR982_04835 [Candidatus Cloacimonadota bacterium]|nr:MAG: hypothetical protein CR982_04835 [Candidatus Cloacimonadota bacterium]PIE77444.1 MAG: hypothetical protein CSA15_12930 [Candidatus Delongbacteria bacterium]